MGRVYGDGREIVVPLGAEVEEPPEGRPQGRESLKISRGAVSQMALAS